MKYKQLKHIINLIKRSIRCPSCNKVFTGDEIDLVDIYEDEGLVNAYCQHCQTGLTINVDVQEFRHGGLPKNIQESRLTEISDNEVQTISEVLKKHKGGMGELLQ